MEGVVYRHLLFCNNAVLTFGIIIIILVLAVVVVLIKFFITQSQ